MKKSNVWLLAAILSVTALPNMNVWAAGQEDSKQAHISFTIDDGYADLPEIKGIFDKYDMKAGIAVISDFVGSSDSYITEEQLLDFYNDGWEVLSHSKTHGTSWKDITETEVREECEVSKEYFDGLGIEVKGFAVPYIYIPENDISIVEDYYEYCLGSTDGEDDPDDIVFPRAHFTSENEQGEEAAVEEMKNQIDELINIGGTRRYFFHYTRQIGQYLTSPDMTIEVLEEVLAYIQNKGKEVVVELPSETADS